MELALLLGAGFVTFGALGIAYYLIKWTAQTFYYSYQTIRTARQIRKQRRP